MGLAGIRRDHLSPTSKHATARHILEEKGNSLSLLNFRGSFPHAVFPFNKRKEVIQCLIVIPYGPRLPRPGSWPLPRSVRNAQNGRL